MQCGREERCIPYGDTLALISVPYKHQVTLKTVREDITFYDNLHRLLDAYPNYFVRASRYALVNPENIVAISTKTKLLAFTNGQTLKYSKKYQKDLLKHIYETHHSYRITK